MTSLRGMRLPGWAWRTIHRVQNRWRDARAYLAGYCNARINPSGLPDGGGYLHWRCARRRGHDRTPPHVVPDPWHRTGNYIWRDGARAIYEPADLLPGIDTGQRGIRARNGTPTMRQTRAINRWHRAERGRITRQRNSR